MRISDWSSDVCSSDLQAAPTMGDALDIKGYVTEAKIGEGSPAIGKTVAEFVERHDHAVGVMSVLRSGMRSFPSPDIVLRDEDTLILGGDPDALERAIATDKLVLEGQHRDQPEGSDDSDIGVIEAVVNTNSILVGQTAGRLRLQRRFGVNLIAISRSGERLTRKLGATVLRAGDVIVLQGPLNLLPERLRDLGALPLAERALRLGITKQGWLPVVILAIAMAATATGLVPVAVAFFVRSEEHPSELQSLMRTSYA